MALQLRRLIFTSFLHRDFNNPSKIAPSMLQFTTVPNYTCSLFLGSQCSCNRKSGRGVHIRKLKSVQRCSAKYNANLSPKRHWRYGSPCSARQSCDFSSVIAGGNGYTLNFLAHELHSERSFSSDGSKIHLSVKANCIVDDAINTCTKHGDPNFAPQMLYGKKKKRNKLLAVFNGVNENLDIEVTNLSTKEGSEKISQPFTGTPEAIESGWNTLKNGEDKKKSTKSSGKIKDGKNFRKQNQNLDSKKHYGISESSSSSSAHAESELLKEATREKKARVVRSMQIAEHKSSKAVAGGAKIGNKEFRPLYPPFGKSVVVVESITKARVIQNYLGDMYEVLASFGHVRDLARRTGSVRPDDNFSMVWEVPSNAWTHLKSIKMALSSAENLILASDPDREGEAIAWHITEMLQQQDALPENITVARVVFHEITESSIKDALQAPREIDSNLVNAYLARRALDYLIGFSISPLLWRKLPGCQSAGRVQSAALALICDREMEIEQFNPQEYWTIVVDFNVTTSNALGRSIISSNLTHLNSKKLEQLSINSKAEGEAISMKVNSSNFEVIDLKRSKVRKNPPMPYITSTLQQDSANKLHFTASYTMKLAQQLYEGIKLSDKEATGLITYMRTDGMHISSEAAEDIHALIRERYGGEFASSGVRKYFKKVKNAQEAHEAIRPTNIRRLPSTLAGILDADSLKLYNLIWSRAMACQMDSVSIDMVQVDIGNKDRDLIFRSVGSRICFSGYEMVYKDRDAGVDVSNYNEKDSNEAAFVVLHQLKVKDTLSLDKVDLNQHHTKPPSRYSEGALVKKLEELGIGRPSTYASIMKVLQDRNYMTTKNRVLHPEFRGRMVSEFLSHHFTEIADYSFTADMENELDNVSAGMTEWKGLLEDYWSRFSNCCNLASTAHIHQVEKMLEEKFNHVLFASLPNDSRLCPSCEEGTLRFKVSRFGSGYFIGCDQHPRCKFIAGTVFNDEDENVDPDKPKTSFPPRLLGCCPNSKEKVYLKNGPYGHYVQLGDDKTGSSQKRSSITEGTVIDSITLKDALDLLQYPINLGNHPDDGHPVMLRHSKVGFSVKHRRTVSPVPRNMNPKAVTLQTGLSILKSKNAKQCGRPKRKPKSEEVQA